MVEHEASVIRLIFDLYLSGLGYKACRLGNACGAMVASRHGCSISMPFWEEGMAFVHERGGL